jgi:hypothetical protein
MWLRLCANLPQYGRIRIPLLGNYSPNHAQIAGLDWQAGFCDAILSGGRTALAMGMGNRRSVGLDFFSETDEVHAAPAKN